MSKSQDNQKRNKFEIIVSLISTLATVAGAVAAILGLCIVTKISVEVTTVSEKQSEIITHYQTKVDTVYVINQAPIAPQIKQQERPKSDVDEWLKEKNTEVKEWMQEKNKEVDEYSKNN